jgi:hypothetical protein
MRNFAISGGKVINKGDCMKAWGSQTSLARYLYTNSSIILIDQITKVVHPGIKKYKK